MPRAGGEAEKLGNHFEGVWTADGLLDLLSGDALSLTVEPFGPDALGIEFVKETTTGKREFHSVKRQTTGATWSLYELAALKGPGRSILSDLLAKLDADANNRVAFVSRTTANDLNEACERALRSNDTTTFTAQLDESPRLKKDFERYVLPLCGHSLDKAFDYLKRTEAVGITEQELIRRVEQRIRTALYRTDGQDVSPLEVRLLLREFVNTRLGQLIRKTQVAAYLAEKGFRERDWAKDATIRKRVAGRNAAYTRQVEAELIQGAAIERQEAESALAALKEDGKRRIAIIGSAGLGKSCAVAQVVRSLDMDGVPVLALRMDIQTRVLTAHALGREMDLPMSPSLVLAGLANGLRCALVIDQLDALSYVSGRNQHLWAVFEELLAEAERYPNMRVLLACRAFDAEHDSRLRRLLANELQTMRIDLRLLETDLVRQIVATAGVDPKVLSEKHVELLRMPLHLSLYLQGDPQSTPSSED